MERAPAYFNLGCRVVEKKENAEEAAENELGTEMSQQP